jgi:hypothetical protein
MALGDDTDQYAIRVQSIYAFGVNASNVSFHSSNTPEMRNEQSILNVCKLYHQLEKRIPGSERIQQQLITKLNSCSKNYPAK